MYIAQLSPGVKLLKEFQAEYAKYEKQRQELTNAEKLFDLPITLYPGLVEVDKELKNITRVYDLYEAQRVRQPLLTIELPRTCIMLIIVDCT